MSAAFIDDEPGSFAAFYSANKDACLQAVLVSIRDLHRAEDATAEAFARAYEQWPAVRDHPRPAAWVVRTAVNRAVSSWRRVRNEDPLDVGRVDLAAFLTDTTAAPGTAGLDPVVHQAVLALPRRQREVVALRVILGYSVADTAHELGIAPGTVTAHLNRANLALRNSLRPQRGVPDAEGSEQS